MVNARRKEKDDSEEEFVYSDLPDDVWQRGGGEAE